MLDITTSTLQHHSESTGSLLPESERRTTLVRCKQCDWSYLLPSGIEVRRCPHCYADQLASLPIDADGSIQPAAPEAYLPFELTDDQVEEAIVRFAQRVPLAPSDLNPQNLRERLQRVFLPRWLVDADLEGTWQAEAGFDYEVVSHEERFEENRKRWTTREVKETRIRWEPRAGRLDRRYHNLDAPAVEEDASIRQQLGAFDIGKAESYRPQVTERSIVRLPNRSTADAWPDAQPLFYKTASIECRKASRADHFRDFQWSPQFSGQNWTQLLLPVYSSFYLDDDDKPRPVLIHGQSSAVSGVRRASQKRARRLAILLIALALIFLLLGAGFAAVSLWADGGAYPSLSALLFIASVICGIGAVIPPAIAWSFNRSQRERDQVFI